MTSNDTFSEKRRSSVSLEQGSPDDLAKRRTTQIAWGDADAQRQSRVLNRSRNNSQRRRSASRDSISSAHMRAQANSSTIPIEFRTLSFSISNAQPFTGEEQVKSSTKPKKVRGKGEVANDFEKVDEHVADITTLLQRLRVAPKQGLSHAAASTRLSENGRNVLPSRKPRYWRKLFKYVFGDFCSILWLAVIVFFICWKPLGNPNPAPYNLGLAILVIIVILLQACFCKSLSHLHNASRAGLSTDI